MIQKFFSKYGLATHLAVLAALPLALTPFMTAATLGSVIIWLTALVAVWFFVEPSLRLGERLSFARARVRRETIRDPLFWLMLVIVVFTCIRWLNTGIAHFYDAEQGIWEVHAPRWPILPASVQEGGFLPFAVSTAVFVVLMGIRHGIGLQARTEFGLFGSLVAGLGGMAAVGCAAGGLVGADAWMASGFEEAPFWPSSFGVWLVLGVVCGIQAESTKWGVARLVLVFSIAGNVGALLFFAPPLIALFWIFFATIVAIFSLCYLVRAASVGAVARSLSLLLFGLALAVFAVMTFMPEDVRELKMRRISPACALEPHEADVEAGKIMKTAPTTEARKIVKEMRAEQLEKARRRRSVLNRIAHAMWKERQWAGAGIDAFGVRVPYLVEGEEWTKGDLPPKPTFSPNGLWTYLAERGILSASLLATLLVLLLYSFVSRLVGAFVYLRKQDDADIFVFAVAPLAWVAPACVVAILVEAVYSPVFQSAAVLFSLTVPLALSAATFPKPKNSVSATENAANTVPVSEN